MISLTNVYRLLRHTAVQQPVGLKALGITGALRRAFTACYRANSEHFVIMIEYTHWSSGFFYSESDVKMGSDHEI